LSKPYTRTNSKGIGIAWYAFSSQMFYFFNFVMYHERSAEQT